MGSKYNKNITTNDITYLGASNVYGWTMSKTLPIHKFKWTNENEVASWGNIQCILEGNLEYPKYLHDLHSNYPLAPEIIEINKVDKSIPSLNNKSKYALHHEKFKFYESIGLRITNIHRGIKFQESAWLKEYIDLNTNLRTKAINDFEKDFFKLINDSVFRKIMEILK